MYRQLNKVLQKVAEIELNETSSRIASDFDHIRQWMEKQPHLNFEIEDQMLLSFLRCSKFSLERTKERIDCYYTMRTLSPEIYTNRDPLLPEIQLILDTGVLLPLPKPLSDDGPRLLLFTYGSKLNPETMTVSNVIKTMYMIVDILVKEDDRCVIGGINTWSTVKNLPAKYVFHLTAPLIKKYITIAQNGTPIRLKGMYATECPPIFQYVYEVCKLFFTKKLSDRMSIYAQTDCKEFYEKIPKHLMPEEYGGSNGSVKQLTVEWKRKVESYRDWLMKDEERKSNEDLRLGSPRTSSDVFGMEGSFRKLDID
ncbi:hypothetical protein PPYR_08728 [Photinus pyralis]|uniref:CRAL-TRIO domain-containing protein n=1 Tax=Photinus pyralis TaxID=7054 RepID=A0A1Y1LM03_PHOPY|nr:retinol-binding protein pinta-like [Photinus pyralis]KAB0797735.1 hypothetical protein PPYR_08728 [Photinus pyralis]